MDAERDEANLASPPQIKNFFAYFSLPHSPRNPNGMGKFRAAVLDSESEEVLEDQFDSPEDGMEIESNFPLIASSSQPEPIVPAKRPTAGASRENGGRLGSGERIVVGESREIQSDFEEDSEVEILEAGSGNDNGQEMRMEELDSGEEREITLEVRLLAARYYSC